MNSMVIQTITKLNELSKAGRTRDLAQEERYFLINVELDLAKSIISDLGDEFAKKVAKAILAIVEK